jgi:hypothetical protein
MLRLLMLVERKDEAWASRECDVRFGGILPREKEFVA